MSNSYLFRGTSLLIVLGVFGVTAASWATYFSEKGGEHASATETAKMWRTFGGWKPGHETVTHFFNRNDSNVVAYDRDYNSSGVYSKLIYIQNACVRFRTYPPNLQVQAIGEDV